MTLKKFTACTESECKVPKYLPCLMDPGIKKGVTLGFTFTTRRYISTIQKQSLRHQNRPISNLGTTFTSNAFHPSLTNQSRSGSCISNQVTQHRLSSTSSIITTFHGIQNRPPLTQPYKLNSQTRQLSHSSTTPRLSDKSNTMPFQAYEDETPEDVKNAKVNSTPSRL